LRLVAFAEVASSLACGASAIRHIRAARTETFMSAASLHEGEAYFAIAACFLLLVGGVSLWRMAPEWLIGVGQAMAVAGALLATQVVL